MSKSLGKSSQSSNQNDIKSSLEGVNNEVPLKTGYSVENYAIMGAPQYQYKKSLSRRKTFQQQATVELRGGFPENNNNLQLLQSQNLQTSEVTDSRFAFNQTNNFK